MIDKIKLLVHQCLNKEFIANSDSPRLVRQVGRKYWLYNSLNDHHLEIILHPDGVIISGSLRKWYFGKTSYNDLSPYQILEVFFEIESFTGLCVDALLDANILIIEWGATFEVPISSSAILGSMFRYSNLPLGKYDTSISFRAYNYWLGAYDKTEEIYKNKKIKTDAVFESVNPTLRIEFKFF